MCLGPYSQGDLTSYRHNTSFVELALPEDGGLSAACANQPQYPYHRLINFCDAASRWAARLTHDCWLRQPFYTLILLGLIRTTFLLFTILSYYILSLCRGEDGVRGVGGVRAAVECAGERRRDPRCGWRRVGVGVGSGGGRVPVGQEGRWSWS